MRLAVFLSLLLIGCASPSLQFLDAAKYYGFKNELQSGQPYLHRLFLNSAAQQNLPFYEELHVYLDGDGTPSSDDPTARQPLILDLLSKDTQPAIVLGRPCYYGLQDSFGCSSSLWTSARYSRDVVSSLVFTLQHWLKNKSTTRLVFIGYSGGGTLVTLLAEHFPQTSSIVTIAGNLDIRAWCDYHHYSPLLESLNPIESAHISPSVRQFHLIGKQDNNVRPKFIERFSRHYQNSQVLLFNDFEHGCCWADVWEEFLQATLK